MISTQSSTHALAPQRQGADILSGREPLEDASDVPRFPIPQGNKRPVAQPAPGTCVERRRETRRLSCDHQDAIGATTSRSSSMKTLSQRSRMQTTNSPTPAREKGSGRPAPYLRSWHDRRPRRGTGLPPHSASASRATLDLFRFQLLYRGGGTSALRN